MREYIDIFGRFKIKIPNHWNYKGEGHGSVNPVTFTLGDKSEDCFQISCISTNKGSVPKILSERNFPNNAYLDTGINFLHRQINTKDFKMNIYEAKIEDNFILATHILPHKENDSIATQEHICQINKSLKTLIIINPLDRLEVKAHGRFNRFMVSLLASTDLINRAQENGSSIELVILYANQIDALLRLALILQKQLQDSTNIIDIRLIFQDEKDKPIFEKEIYDQAFNEKLIEEPLFVNLKDLYNLRNKVVHRYIISDLKTNHIVELVINYMKIHEIISRKVRDLEQKQFMTGIGLYGHESNPEDSIDDVRMKGLIMELHEKHANMQVIKEMTIGIGVNDMSTSCKINISSKNII